MYPGFPRDMLPLLRCPADAGALSLQADEHPGDAYILQAVLRCGRCSATYPVADGIAVFLDPDSLDAESGNERQRRDEAAADQDDSWEAESWSEMEIEAMIEASEPLADARVLELGAGTGRHTVRMARRGATILAVDFSAASLRHLATRVQPGWRLGLVQADCTRLAVAPAAFDLVASTLMSNLPTPAHRSALMRLAASAVRPRGRFVFGTHHYGLRSVLTREPRSGYYRGAPIYRYMFRRREIDAETAPHFVRVRTHPIQVIIPFIGRVHAPVVRISRLAERLPVINGLGGLLLTVASQPRVGAPPSSPGSAAPSAGPAGPAAWFRATPWSRTGARTGTPSGAGRR